MSEIFGVANALAVKDKRIAELEAENERLEKENDLMRDNLLPNTLQTIEWSNKYQALREAAQAVVDDAHYHVDLQSTPKEVATVASRLLDALAALLEGKADE